MRKVFGEKVYDTDTAMAMAFYECSLNRSSRYYFGERLYLTDDGAYFLHGVGGFLTHYAQELPDGSRRSGEDIIPMDFKSAKRWVQSHYNYGLLIDPHFASIIAVLKQR